MPRKINLLRKKKEEKIEYFEVAYSRICATFLHIAIRRADNSKFHQLNLKLTKILKNPSSSTSENFKPP